MLNFPTNPQSGQVFPVTAIAGQPQYWWDNTKNVWQRYKKIPYFFDGAPLIAFPSSVDSDAIINIAWDGIALPSWVLIKNDIAAATKVEVPIVTAGVLSRNTACVNVGSYVEDTMLSFSIAETINDAPVATSNVILVRSSNVVAPTLTLSTNIASIGDSITVSWTAHPRNPNSFDVTKDGLDLYYGDSSSSVRKVRWVNGFNGVSLDTTQAGSLTFTFPAFFGYYQDQPAPLGNYYLVLTQYTNLSSINGPYNWDTRVSTAPHPVLTITA